MKIESDFSNLTLIPESNEEWFEAGRITKNLGIEPRKNTSHLNPTIELIELPLNIVLNMLSEGEIQKKQQ